jgi:VLRF1 release factor-like protein
VERLHRTKKQLLALLPDAGAPGWTSYALPGKAPDFDLGAMSPEDADKIVEVATESATGSVLLLRGSDAMLVIPPFPVEEADAYSEIWAKPLVELLERRRTVAIFLLRLGGFTTGVFRDGFLVDSKTDRRFVKNRHRKGGQSQRRFDRIREKQVHLLFEMACQEAREKLEPYAAEIQHVILGGDRLTLLAFRKECKYFERFGERLLERTLLVPGDPRKATLEQMPREIWSSEVYRSGGSQMLDVGGTR